MMNYYPLVKTIDEPEAVILADGSFPLHPLPLFFLSSCRRIVCCDGAAEALIQRGRIPEAIVGDGDSLNPAVQDRYAALIHWETEQETNDLSKAFRYCLRKGWKKLFILGATGRREDHTIGNISLLSDYQEQAEVQMLTDYGVFTPVCGNAGFECFPGQQVSVFNRDCHLLSGEGLVYPLSAFTNWWEGTLNEAIGKTFKIYADGRLWVYRVYDNNRGNMPGGGRSRPL